MVPISTSPQAIVLRMPVSPITGVMLNHALFDTSKQVQSFTKNMDVRTYFLQYMTGPRNAILLDKTLMVRERLAFAALNEMDFSNMEHIVGRHVWSFIGPDKLYPKLPARGPPAKRARSS